MKYRVLATISALTLVMSGVIASASASAANTDQGSCPPGYTEFAVGNIEQCRRPADHPNSLISVRIINAWREYYSANPDAVRYVFESWNSHSGLSGDEVIDQLVSGRLTVSHLRQAYDNTNVNYTNEGQETRYPPRTPHRLSDLHDHYDWDNERQTICSSGDHLDDCRIAAKIPCTQAESEAPNTECDGITDPVEYPYGRRDGYLQGAQLGYIDCTASQCILKLES